MKRILARILFVLFSAALLYGVITYPKNPHGVTLYIAESLPLSFRVTPTAAAVADGAEGLRSESLEEPPPEPEPEVTEPGDILTLMYHDLVEDEDAAGTWAITPEGLQAQLRDLAGFGYLPLSVEDYIAGNYKAGQDYYIVTFDDGYLSNLTLAEPLLASLEVPATVFVITGSTELANHMSWEQLAELQAGGVISVYSHTHSHLNGEETSTAAFLADVERSWKALCANLGEEPAYRILSYPNGAYTRETMRALAQDGYALFVVQNRPYWYKENNAEGIRVLVRMNAAHGADMENLADYNRDRAGVPTTVAEKLELERRAELARIAAIRAARRDWLARQIARMQLDVR